MEHYTFQNTTSMVYTLVVIIQISRDFNNPMKSLDSLYIAYMFRLLLYCYTKFYRKVQLIELKRCFGIDKRSCRALSIGCFCSGFIPVKSTEPMLGVEINIAKKAGAMYYAIRFLFLYTNGSGGNSKHHLIGCCSVQARGIFRLLQKPDEPGYVFIKLMSLFSESAAVVLCGAAFIGQVHCFTHGASRG
ncbi:MAG: hypothetical protein U5L01_05505 [Rheinheimera sp.]|nr:hypothetical protein [Rheinheimera sp.]